MTNPRGGFPMQNTAADLCPFCGKALKLLPQLLVVDVEARALRPLPSKHPGVPKVSDKDLRESLQMALDWMSGKALRMGDLRNAVTKLRLGMAARGGCEWGCPACDERHFLQIGASASIP